MGNSKEHVRVIMAKQEQQFEIKDNVNLVFQSMGKLYQLRLRIDSGLMFLSELKQGEKEKERVIFISEEGDKYTGEPLKENEEVREVKQEQQKKPKKRNKK